MGSIVVTGAAGFIGSCLVSSLNRQGFDQLILVDDFSRKDKQANLQGKRFQHQVDRLRFFEWLSAQQPELDFVFHIGARTDTTEFRYAVHQELNVHYSQQVWNYCTQQNIPLLYASSAATYGSGAQGYDDDLRLLPDLQPLNPYGESKQEFDKWVLHQEDHPPFWAGLKFFNVYGPNEYHKGRMASVIWHAFRQIREKGVVKLFRSHRSNFKDGEQLRDFIYVKDVLTVCDWFFQRWRSAAPVASSIYNLGTGKARTFNDLVSATFRAMGLPVRIEYIDMPEDLRDTYQYFTEAKMDKLRKAGYTKEFYTLEQGVEEYVREFLLNGKYY